MDNKLKIIGRGDGILICTLSLEFLHNEDQIDLKNVYCVALDLLSGQISECVTVEQLEHVFPFKYVKSTTEEEILLELIPELIPNKTLVEISGRLREKQRNYSK